MLNYVSECPLLPGHLLFVGLVGPSEEIVSGPVCQTSRGLFWNPVAWNKATIVWSAREDKKKAKADPRGLSSLKNRKGQTIGHNSWTQFTGKYGHFFHGWSQHSAEAFFIFPLTVWSTIPRAECRFGSECKYSGWGAWLFSSLMKGIIRTARWINFLDKDAAAAQLSCFMVKCLTAAPPFGPQVQITSFRSFHLNANGPLLEGRLCGHCCNHSVLFCRCGKCFVCWRPPWISRSHRVVPGRERRSSVAKVVEFSVRLCLSAVIAIQAILLVCSLLLRENMEVPVSGGGVPQGWFSGPLT